MHAPSPRPAPLLVFDLDGTLADTAPDLISTLRVVLAQEGVPPLPYDEARDMLGAGARALVERGLAAAGRTVPKQRIEELFHAFVAHYGAHVADESRLFPGVAAALDALAAQGFRFAVCTNKLEGLAVQVLEALGVAHRFDAICGQDTFREADGTNIPKPDPRMLAMTVEKAGGRLDRAIMIGDSETDVATARNAGTPVIAVDFGYTTIPVPDLNPDVVISHFDALPAAVAALAKAMA
ncbi:MAG: phosphoglycolate phosphatase [Rhizobiales bacterium]|nr:phosphoglycolate phosphatase [Hyphomicrobiales bacterium]